MNCKYYRTRTEKNIKYGYCLKDKKKVPFFCKKCEEYKKTIEEKLKVSNNKALKCTTTCRQLKQSRQKSKKMAKLERNRFSILTNDLEHCIICGKTKNHLHEVFPGAFRQRSMKEHMVIPLCAFHHRQIHKDIELSLYWKRSCQKLFEKSHTRNEFIKTFGRSYL